MPFPAKQDFGIWVGNTTPINFVFKDANSDPFDLTGSRLVFTTNNGIRWASDDNASPFYIADFPGGVAFLRLTPAMTRLFTAATNYEIEMWLNIDEQYSLQYGVITPSTGTNDDVNP